MVLKVTFRQKKKGKTKKKAPLLPPHYPLPPFEDPLVVTPRITLNLRVENQIMKSLTLEDVMITTRLQVIADKVMAWHGGAINNLSLCLNYYRESEVLPLNATLEEVGMGTPGVYNLVYDFDPVSHPLLL